MLKKFIALNITKKPKLEILLTRNSKTEKLSPNQLYTKAVTLALSNSFKKTLSTRVILNEDGAQAIGNLYDLYTTALQLDMLVRNAKFGDQTQTALPDSKPDKKPKLKDRFRPNLTVKTNGLA